MGAKEYRVTLPIAGIITVYVDAESQEEAIDKALEVPWAATATGDIEMEELEAFRALIEGNVSCIWHTQAEAKEIFSEVPRGEGNES